MHYNSRRIKIKPALGSRIFLYEFPRRIVRVSEGIKILDEVCSDLDLIPLDSEWESIPFEQACDLFAKALGQDLAYHAPLRQEKEVARLMERLFAKIDASAETLAFCNWYEPPFGEGGAWNPITEYTFDLALPIFYGKRLLFAYFICED